MIESRCSEVGTLTIETERIIGLNDNCECGCYAHYHHGSAEALHKVASGYSRVERPTGLIQGKNYTLRMAQNDYKKYDTSI